MYVAAGADLINPYPDVTTPAVGGAVTSSATFKREARALLASSHPPGPWVLVGMTPQGAVKLVAASMASEQEALSELAISASHRQYTRYVGVFRREPSAPGGWAEVKTQKVTAEGNVWLVPTLAAAGGVLLLWALSRSTSRARARRRTR